MTLVTVTKVPFLVFLSATFKGGICYTGLHMKREHDFFVRVKVLAVEIVSTIVFLVLVCWAAVWEILHLLGR